MVRFSDRVWGPDVSSWQGVVDWNAVRQDGASFGITKITEGVNYVNPYAKDNWQGMADNKLVRVQYHYARVSQNSYGNEAEFFLRNMLPVDSGDIVALDLEMDSRDPRFIHSANWADGWLKRIADELGFQPMLYCNAGILRDPDQGFITHSEMGEKTGLWLAAWDEVFPAAVAPWQTVALWQFTNSGIVPGIAGAVDLNIFNGTLETMKKYGSPEWEDTAGTPDPFQGINPDKVSGFVSAIGYMGGDLADQLAEELRLRGGQYDSVLAHIVRELRRVKLEQLG